MATKFTEAFIQSFTESAREAIDAFDVDARLKLMQSAERVAALFEITLRTPEQATAIRTALKMERGIIETLVAQTAVDATHAMRDAALSAAGVLIAIALD